MTLPTDDTARGELLGTIMARCIDDAGCLVWQGARNNAGHPVMRLQGRAMLVRRVVYELTVGPIAPGAKLITTCGCPGCVLGKHAIARSHRGMMQYASRQGRLASPLRTLKTAQAMRRKSRWSDADIEAFRNAPGSVLERAERFGMSPTYAYLVHRGEARLALSSPLSPMHLRMR